MEKILEIIAEMETSPYGIVETQIDKETLSLIERNAHLFTSIETDNGRAWMPSANGFIFAQNDRLRRMEKRLELLEIETKAIRAEMNRGASSSFT